MTNKTPPPEGARSAAPHATPGPSAPLGERDSRDLYRTDGGGQDRNPQILHADFDSPAEREPRGAGAEAGGQSGDTLGLSRDELAGPESVEELIEEGQSYEAAVIEGVENAPDADQGEVRTRQVPEDDVPQEYLDQERERDG
jgi:hypothetical protein